MSLLNEPLSDFCDSATLRPFYLMALQFPSAATVSVFRSLKVWVNNGISLQSKHVFSWAEQREKCLWLSLSGKSQPWPWSNCFLRKCAVSVSGHGGVPKTFPETFPKPPGIETILCDLPVALLPVLSQPGLIAYPVCQWWQRFSTRKHSLGLNYSEIRFQRHAMIITDSSGAGVRRGVETE